MLQKNSDFIVMSLLKCMATKKRERKIRCDKGYNENEEQFSVSKIVNLNCDIHPELETIDLDTI